MTIDANDIGKILLIKFGGIGDVIFATPLIKTIKKTFPKARLTVLTSPRGGSEVLNGSPYVDRIFVFDPSKATMKDVLILIRKLKKEKFDMSFSTIYNLGFKNSLFAYLAGARIRVGYNHRGKGFLYTHKAVYRPNDHYIEQNLALLEPLKIENPERDVWIHITDKERAAAEDFVRENIGMRKSNLIIGFHPGSGSDMDFKRWPKERFAELADIVVKRYGAVALLFGGRGEEAIIAEVENMMKEKPVKALDKDLKTTAAIIERCALFITNDTGLMNVAVAAGTPVIAIYGPTRPQNTRPIGNNIENIIVRKAIACSPCQGRYLKNGKAFIRCKDVECLKKIYVHDVVSAIDHKLNNFPKNTGRQKVKKIWMAKEWMLGC